MLAFHRRRLLSLLLIGIAGLVVSAAFAYLAAPDLALTQITVEVVTVLLMLLSLSFLPAATPKPADCCCACATARPNCTGRQSP